MRRSGACCAIAGAVESITSTRTTIVLEVVKETGVLPIGEAEREEEEAASA